MADGKIYITISDTRGGGSGGGDGRIPGRDADDTTPGGSGGDRNPSPYPSEMLANTIKENKYLTHEAIHFLRAESMALINNYIGTIGERTGNYLAQQNAQVAVGLAGKMAGIAMAGATGFKLSGGNPLGMAFGVGVASLLSMTNMDLSWRSYERQIKKQNMDIAEVRRRAGLDSLNDGSRGTEN